MSEVNTLENEAKKRQERLKSLKRKREEKSDGDNNNKTGSKENGDKVTLPKYLSQDLYQFINFVCF